MTNTSLHDLRRLVTWMIPIAVSAMAWTVYGASLGLFLCAPLGYWYGTRVARPLNPMRRYSPEARPTYILTIVFVVVKNSFLAILSYLFLKGVNPDLIAWSSCAFCFIATYQSVLSYRALRESGLSLWTSDVVIDGKD